MRSLAAVLALLLGACGAGPSRTSSAREAIVGGTDDPNDPAVVAFGIGTFAACSGTLVSPNAVLTAGHCANFIGQSDEYIVTFGEDAAQPQMTAHVVEQRVHPQFTDAGAPFDFAMLRLDAPVAGVAPVPLRTAPLSQADVGAPIRHVGFGISDETARTGRGTKRSVTYAITEVDADVVWSGGPGQQTCDGDSGGPGFMSRDAGEELAAVVSDGPNCHDAGWDGRVDVAADWIAQTIAAWTPDAGPPDSGPPDAGPPPMDASSGGCGSGAGVSMLALLAALLLFRRR